MLYLLSVTPSIADYVSRDDTLRAEVMWALKINTSHYSYSSSDDIAMLLRTMFPDSAIEEFHPRE